MAKVKEWGLFVIGVISVISVNAIAFVFDGSHIDTAIALDSMFIGALIVKYFNDRK